ncbi:MAG: Stealth CR1 domain-containing protein [Bacteroidales bacterium]|nr:Stealth CR1 domain-containing protein [Bacteroidales bacterium]
MEIQSNDTIGLPIDAVIAWVDGSDREHAAKRQGYLSTNTPRGSESADPTRRAPKQ